MTEKIKRNRVRSSGEINIPTTPTQLLLFNRYLKINTIRKVQSNGSADVFNVKKYKSIKRLMVYNMKPNR